MLQRMYIHMAHVNRMALNAAKSLALNLLTTVQSCCRAPNSLATDQAGVRSCEAAGHSAAGHSRILSAVRFVNYCHLCLNSFATQARFDNAVTFDRTHAFLQPSYGYPPAYGYGIQVIVLQVLDAHPRLQFCVHGAAVRWLCAGASRGRPCSRPRPRPRRTCATSTCSCGACIGAAAWIRAAAAAAPAARQLISIRRSPAARHWFACRHTRDAQP